VNPDITKGLDIDGFHNNKKTKLEMNFFNPFLLWLGTQMNTKKFSNLDMNLQDMQHRIKLPKC
jgi:hypothetical protein